MENQKNNNKKQQARPEQPEIERVPQFWGMSQRDFFSSLNGDLIELATLDGKIIKGRLKGFGQFDLIIEQEDATTILVFKHALKYARKAKSDHD